MTSLDPHALGLAPHPEGGWFRETWRSERRVDTSLGSRRLATCVAFLLQPGQESAWHRVASDELWLWQGGGSLDLLLGGEGDAPADGSVVTLGIGGQHLVPARTWQSARPSAQETVLVACVVAPGFEFDDFELHE